VDAAPTYGDPVVRHFPGPGRAPERPDVIANEDLLMPVATQSLQQDNSVSTAKAVMMARMDLRWCCCLSHGCVRIRVVECS
jgi:hypothetical protein